MESPKIKNISRKWLLLIFLFLGIGGVMTMVIFNARRHVNSPTMVQPASESLVDHAQVPLMIGHRQLTVEVVNTPASITQGLSGRSEIGSDGMLFLFDELRLPQFWMKEMTFSLDLVWIREDKVAHVTPEVPYPSPATPWEELPRYSPPFPVDAVLEIPAGKAKEWGIKPGDLVVKPS